MAPHLNGTDELILYEVYDLAGILGVAAHELRVRRVGERSATEYKAAGMLAEFESVTKRCPPRGSARRAVP